MKKMPSARAEKKQIYPDSFYHQKIKKGKNQLICAVLAPGHFPFWGLFAPRARRKLALKTHFLFRTFMHRFAHFLCFLSFSDYFLSYPLSRIYVLRSFFSPLPARFADSRRSLFSLPLFIDQKSPAVRFYLFLSSGAASSLI